MRDYTKIKAWQLSDDLTVAIYAATKSFPKDEMYGLTSQITSSSRQGDNMSVPTEPVPTEPMNLLL